MDQDTYEKIPAGLYHQSACCPNASTSDDEVPKNHDTKIRPVKRARADTMQSDVPSSKRQAQEANKRSSHTAPDLISSDGASETSSSSTTSGLSFTTSQPPTFRRAGKTAPQINKAERQYMRPEFQGWQCCQCQELNDKNVESCQYRYNGVSCPYRCKDANCSRECHSLRRCTHTTCDECIQGGPVP